MINLNTFAEFTWGFGQRFFLETNEGNFVWSDPEYNGDNTISPFRGTYKNWVKQENIPFGRGKGRHTIKSYCGKNVVFCHVE